MAKVNDKKQLDKEARSQIANGMHILDGLKDSPCEKSFKELFQHLKFQMSFATMMHMCGRTEEFDARFNHLARILNEIVPEHQEIEHEEEEELLDIDLSC